MTSPHPRNQRNPLLRETRVARGLPLQRDQSQARQQRGGAWAAEATPPGPHVHLSGAGRVLPSQVYQEEETIGLQHAFSVVKLDPSLAAAPQPHSGRTWDRPSPPPLPPGIQPHVDAGCGRGPQMVCPELAPGRPASLPPAPLTLSFRPPSAQRPEQGTRPASWPLSPSAPPTDPQSLPAAAGSLACSNLPATQPSTAPSLPAQGSPGRSSFRLSPWTLPCSGPGLAGPSRQHPHRPAFPMAGTPYGRPPGRQRPRRPSPTPVVLCLSPDLVWLTGKSRLEAVQGPVPGQPSGLRGAELLPEALASPDTHSRPIVPTADAGVCR